jgi:ATP-dependent Zn protease
MNAKTRNIVFFVVLLVVAIALALAVGDRTNRVAMATYTDFLQQVQAGAVDNARIVTPDAGATQVIYKLKNGSRMQTIAPRDYREALTAMQQMLVNVEIRDAGSQRFRVLLNSAPFLILLGVWFVMFYKLKRGGGRPLFQG